MKPFFCFSIFPLLFLTFLIASQSALAQNSIYKTCKTFAQNDPNVNYNFCTTSLQLYPASQNATLQEIGKISIRLIQYNMTDTRFYIKNLIKNKKWDSYTKQCLSDCFELFSDAIPSVKKAMKYYNKKLYGDANVQLSAVMDDATTCEDGFNERGVVSPLTKRTGDAFQLSAIALSAVYILRTGSN
ncbi:Plant invertase/pectin methylesterase inhibitor superfamily protein [Forsythia ovata]|uniref:Plant invertase/pectin methylesterase inhibitor superfamily protein n=1 Tax=Forsythia ovata TaxID=205694 RepID=A0ABD1QQ17_9LAMI